MTFEDELAEMLMKFWKRVEALIMGDCTIAITYSDTFKMWYVSVSREGGSLHYGSGASESLFTAMEEAFSDFYRRVQHE